MTDRKKRRVMIFSALTASLAAAITRTPAWADEIKPMEITYSEPIDFRDLRLERYQRQAPRPRDLYKQKRRGK